VFDVGSGCGLAAIAAARCAAAHVVACDVDPLAAESQQTNAELNGVGFESLTRDPVGLALPDVDVVLAGDVCYERRPAQEITGWLRQLAANGLLILLADPGRAYAPSDGVELLSSYVVQTSRELESADQLDTVVWRIA
jgi:predicted nicotinamide N-methyase